VDLLLIAGMYGGYAVRFSESLLGAEVETSVRLGALAKRFTKPILVQSLYGTLKPEPLVVLKEAGVPVFIWPENAVRCAAEVVRYGRARRRLEGSPPIAAGPASEAATAIVAGACAAGRESLYEFEAKALLGAYGIEAAGQRVVRAGDEIAAAAAHFGDRPVAMKIVSEDILHKSDAGGVKLDVSGETAIRAAYQEILANARAYDEHARIEGVLVSPMARPGVEVIIGVVQDPIFGPVIMFGLGGIFVEILKDVAFRAVPLSRADAEEMIDQIAARKILDGVRGQPPVDRDALVDLIAKVSSLVQAHPEIAEVDLNPVIARDDGYDVVDARMILRSAP
jgi:acetyltransferase